MRTRKASVLAPLLLLTLAVCSARQHAGPLAALSSGVKTLANSLISDPWSVSGRSEPIQVRRPGDEVPWANSSAAWFKGTQTWSLEKNRTINSFLGIKFATAPYRFKYSGPTTPMGEVDATAMGPICKQGGIAGQVEDCLYLNVYVPAELQGEETALPVMVFIHGGSFTSGGTPLYLPTRLLDEDVILVVIQYRLGSLGWFSLDNDDAPGNAGLSDQLNALRWVKKNIATFNGDPERVTVFGESAGSVSVSLIVAVADPEEHLFQGAICESGSALEYWAIDEHPLQSAMELAEICGCSDTNETVIFDYLVRADVDKIVECTHTYVSLQRKNARLGFDGTAPVVQSNETVSHPLITMLPIKYLEQGLSNKVPLMSGCNRDEGSFVFSVVTDAFLEPNGLMNDTELFAQYFTTQAIPDILRAAGIDDSTHVFSNALQEKFLPGVNMASYDDVADGMVDMTGMLFLKSGTYNYARMHARFTNRSSYYYSFDFLSNNSLFDLSYAPDEPPFYGGVTHADELMYLFSIPSALDEGQRLTSKRMVKLWTNFAKFGNPTPDDELGDIDLVKWEPLSEDGHNFLLIEDAVTLGGYYPDRYTIRMDIIRGVDTTTSTESPTGMVGSHTDEEYEDLEKQSDAFMASMITFIVLFVISTGAAVFFFMKTR